MGFMGAFSGVITIFVLIAIVLAFLMPFFVLRIRNELISMNRKMARLIELLSAREDARGEVSTSGRIKVCPHCNAKNRQEDHVCLNCGNSI
jgi:uncharacterized membrane protein